MLNDYVLSLIQKHEYDNEVDAVYHSLLVQLMAWQNYAEKLKPAGTARGKEAQLDRAQTLVHWVRQSMAQHYPQFPNVAIYFFDIWQTARNPDNQLSFLRTTDVPEPDDFHDNKFRVVLERILARHMIDDGRGIGAFVFVFEDQGERPLTKELGIDYSTYD